MLILASLLLLLPLIDAACPPGVTAISATVPDGFCAYQWSTGVALAAPRQLLTLSNNDVLVIEQRTGSLSVLYTGPRGTLTKATLSTGLGLSHSVRVQGNYVYASSPTTVYRWPFTVGTRTNLGTAQTVVFNVPCCHHSTRSLEFDSAGLLYVQVGSGSNVDPDPSHAQIRQFDVTNVPVNGSNWLTGYLFASGMRNEVSIRFDGQGRLWGVENGRDDLYRADLGGDIHNNNPCEELNFFNTPGKFYGYPYCWSVGQLTVNGTAIPPATQYADPAFINDGTHTDAWCQNTNNVLKPYHCFGAHNAPMDLYFVTDTFPAAYQGLFVSFHGSWDRQPPVGHQVIFMSVDATGMPIAPEMPFFTTPNNPRPVGFAMGPCALGRCLLISDDGSGQIYAVGYYNPASTTAASPPPAPVTTAARVPATTGVSGPPSCATLVYNRAINGQSIGQQTVTSASSCCSYCLSNSRCNGYIYDIRNTSNRICTALIVSSGYTVTFMSGVDYALINNRPLA